LGPILTILAVGLYGLFHSILASRSAKKWAESNFGSKADRFYRLIFNVVGLLTLLPVMAIPLLLPGKNLYHLSGIWLVLATLGQVMAVLFLVYGVLQTDPWQFLGLRQLANRFGEDGQHLVVNGLYRCVRHPLYLAGMVFIWLFPFMTTSLLVLNLSLTMYIFIGSIFEERRLLAKFGPAYEAYRERVPRLLPNISHCLFHHS
jgi:protein-S-isoprenylcysteine O-methyltransferase Ste14